MKYLMLLIVLMLFGMSASAAQPTNVEGLLLINVTELGAASNPNRLYLADVGTAKFAELVVENRSVFAPWFGWSPDGSRFAYLAPARRGINYELWLGDASVTNPRPRPPLFELNLTVNAADWNPSLNVIAVGTSSQNARDGLYLVNANFENVVFLGEEVIPQNALLDWAHRGFWLAYSTASGGMSMINVDSESVVPLLPQTLTAPALLPLENTGWTSDDRYYVFTDDLYEQLHAVTTDGFSTETPIDEDFAADLFGIQMIPNTNHLLTVIDKTVMIFDIERERLQTFDLDIPNEITADYAVLDENTLLLNSFILIGEDRFAECLLVNLRDQSIQFIRDSFAAANWAHTRCIGLGDGSHIAIMATTDLQPYDRLAGDLLYDLYIVPSSLNGSTFLTSSYAGFEASELGFSSTRGQVVFQEGDALVVYNLLGQKKTLVSLRDLNITSEFVDFDYVWQP